MREPRRTPQDARLGPDVSDVAAVPGAALDEALRCRAAERGTARRCLLDAPHLGVGHLFEVEVNAGRLEEPDDQGRRD